MPRQVMRAAWVAVAFVPAFVSCLQRPAEPFDPTLKTNFTLNQSSRAIDKVDLLFVIDNSASMADKQRLLAQAVPDMIERLVSPYCVDQEGVPVRDASNEIVHASSTGACASGEAEFSPVVDMHIGVVSSSLGLPGVLVDKSKDLVDVCAEQDGRNHNDRGRLIDRKADGSSVPEAAPSRFLSWFPSSERNAGKVPPANPITSQVALSSAFASMVEGVGEKGCGFEAQLESMYRFLIDPEPYESATHQSGKTALAGVDETILSQRAAFLRPDSLVAVIMLTDENESTFDPAQNGATAWRIGSTGKLPRPTNVCAANPVDGQCLSCGLEGVTAAECTGAPFLSDADDRFNIRFFEPKRRFGFDPRFDPMRYVDGLSLPTYKKGSEDCVNPLYAAALPTSKDQDLCNLGRGPRLPSLVFFAVIGGVPNDLLRDANGKYIDDLKVSHFDKIIGRDPSAYDFTDVDPRMRESVEPRVGRPAPGSADVTRDRNIPNGDDLQYACTFELDQSRECGTNKDCDCNREPESLLCNGTLQVRGKAYPTLRQFEVVKKLIERKSRGAQATIASLCPSEVRDKKSEEYGYRPAARTIVNRLARSLNNQCLPQPLTVSKVKQIDGSEILAVSCLVLETLPEGRTTCDPALGLSDPDPEVLKVFRREQKAQWNKASGLPDPDTLTVCELKQLPANVPCQTSSEGANGWCYVSGKAAGTCLQALQLPKNLSNDVRISLQCVQTQSP